MPPRTPEAQHQYDEMLRQKNRDVKLAQEQDRLQVHTSALQAKYDALVDKYIELAEKYCERAELVSLPRTQPMMDPERTGPRHGSGEVLLVTVDKEGAFYSLDQDPKAPIRIYSSGRIEDDFNPGRKWMSPDDFIDAVSAAKHNRLSGVN